jgi:FAD/FMN-containing dehydrogenase
MDTVETLTARLVGRFGPEMVKSGQVLRDGGFGGWDGDLDAGLAILPQTTADVSRLMIFCTEHRIGVVPQGGRTGLSGACRSQPGEIILMTGRMNRIVSLDPVSGVAVVESGVTLEALENAAGSHGLSGGVDLGSRGSCTIGGMISTNAGGMEAFRHGTMRQRILGLEIVLPDGSVLSDLTRVLKANAGYDLKQLFIGAEGTLGIVTKAAIRLTASVGDPVVAMIQCPTFLAAMEIFWMFERPRFARLTRAEVMSRNHVTLTARELGLHNIERVASAPISLIIEVRAPEESRGRDDLEAVLADALAEGFAADAIVAGNERERSSIWQVREAWAVDRLFPGGLWFDVSVPPSMLDNYVVDLNRRLDSQDPSLRLFFIGHLGDGNLHLTINSGRPVEHRHEEISAIVYADLDSLGGSFSAEHGIGLEKRAFLARHADPQKYRLMRALKTMLDPFGIMNPGKVIPTDP